MKSIGIVGANGYTGYELLRLLTSHPKVKVNIATSRKMAGKTIASLYPTLLGFYGDKKFVPIDVDDLAENCDLIFTCLPHGLSAETGAKIIEKGKMVVDLSADFRYDNIDLFERTYKIKHPATALNKEAVYGLTELYSHDIKKAKLVANPGCYTTASILPLYPLLKEGVISHSNIIIDAKSGASGAGRQASEDFSICEAASNFKAYSVLEHRHNSEIDEKLSLAFGAAVSVCFTPHLLPVKRGILVTIYADLKKSGASVDSVFEKYYSKSSFVRVLGEGNMPDIKSIVFSNECRIGYKICFKSGRLVIVSCIDNLIKGASGQAIQNMNLMLGLPEAMGLPMVGAGL